ncbi:hypothetical protein [Gottfriedia acidiceleris]|uniref:hypothetical protein n=1 Tax=Gottfriedia acidiceleris TaxID=371036 RepID=UPI002FFE36B8
MGDSWEQSILTSDSLPAEVTFIYQANPVVPTVWFHLALGETYSACFLLRGITVVLFATLEWYRRMTTTRRVLFTQQALHLNSFFSTVFTLSIVQNSSKRRKRFG